jgi:hypothetical protein
MHHDTAKACDALLHIVRQDPKLFGEKQNRWTLKAILRACPNWKVKSVPGMSRLVRRLGIRYKRGRCRVHSPDPDYVAKLRDIKVLVKPQVETGSMVVLFQDEFTYYRQPSVARAYESQPALACSGGVGCPLRRRDL